MKFEGEEIEVATEIIDWLFDDVNSGAMNALCDIFDSFQNGKEGATEAFNEFIRKKKREKKN